MLRFTLAKIDRLAAKRQSTPLLPLLNDRREAVRLAAIRALGSCGDDLSYDTLISLIRHSEAAVRKTAVLALADTKRIEGRVHIERQRCVEKDSQVLAIIETVLMQLCVKSHTTP